MSRRFNFQCHFRFRTHPLPIALALCALASPLSPRIAQAQLRSPWDAQSITLTDTPYDCPPPPPFEKTLNIEGYYIDAHHSVIDPVKKAAEEKATAAPTHLGQWSTEAANAYLTKGSRAATTCVGSAPSPIASRITLTARSPTARAMHGTTTATGRASLSPPPGSPSTIEVISSGASTPIKPASIRSAPTASCPSSSIAQAALSTTTSTRSRPSSSSPNSPRPTVWTSTPTITPPFTASSISV